MFLNKYDLSIGSPIFCCPQDRSYCLGPALLCKFMLDAKLTGSVIMSHFDIPSTVGYMASLLTNVNHEPEDKLRVYGVTAK